MKGKKADKLAAAEKQADASASLAEFGEDKMKKSSSILKQELSMQFYFFNFYL